MAKKILVMRLYTLLLFLMEGRDYGSDIDKIRTTAIEPKECEISFRHPTDHVCDNQLTVIENLGYFELIG